MIAEEWPRSLDDSAAFEDWGWKYDLAMHDLASKILKNIEPKYKQGRTINMGEDNEQEMPKETKIRDL